MIFWCHYITSELNRMSTHGLLVHGDITVARHCRDRLHHRALLSGCQSDWKLFCEACNRVNSLLRSAKCYYRTCLSSWGHPSRFWLYFHYMFIHKGMKPKTPTNLILMLMILMGTFVHSWQGSAESSHFTCVSTFIYF